MTRLETALVLAVILVLYGLVGADDYQIAAAQEAEARQQAAVAVAERAVALAEAYRRACVDEAPEVEARPVMKLTVAGASK